MISSLHLQKKSGPEANSPGYPFSRRTCERVCPPPHQHPLRIRESHRHRKRASPYLKGRPLLVCLIDRYGMEGKRTQEPFPHRNVEEVPSVANLWPGQLEELFLAGQEQTKCEKTPSSLPKPT